MPSPLDQPLLNLVIHGALWLIPALLVLTALKRRFSARLKGAAGERAVRRVPKRLGGAALHDIILPDGRGGLTQIEHLVLTPAGLLVIETKHYAGQVLGQARDPTWTQRLGRRSFTFQNPLRQNHLHLQAARALTPDVPIQGCVVFTDAARFPKGVPEGVSTVSMLRVDPAAAVPGRGGVDEPIAVGDCGFDSTRSLFRGALKDTKPEGRHLDAVVQRDKGTSSRSLSDLPNVIR